MVALKWFGGARSINGMALVQIWHVEVGSKDRWLKSRHGLWVAASVYSTKRILCRVVDLLGK